MKKNRFVRLLFFLLFTGCVHDPLDHPHPGNYSDFTVAHAKAFFENNATDLQNVRFGEKAMSRSNEDVNISPDWKSAQVIRTGKITTVEIPLGGDVNKLARVSGLDLSKTSYRILSKVTVKLVVQKHDDIESPRQFVVTMIDGLLQRLQKKAPDNCYGPNRYNGLIIVSALTGEYLEAFRSVNGLWTRVHIAAGTPETSEKPLATMRLSRTGSSPETYSTGEEDSSTCPRCGNSLSFCTCCKVCGGEGCDECMATVYPTCSKCGNSPCTCCPICHNTPCTCDQIPDPTWRCPHCGYYYCVGQCVGGGGETPTPEEPIDPEDPEDPDECPHDKCPVCGKAIRIPTRASECDAHEYCENDGKCVKVEVRLSQTKVTLGEEYTITLELTPANAVYSYVSYAIVQDGTEYALVHPGGQPTTLTTMARVPGNFQIKGEITQESGKEFSGTANITQEYPTRAEILEELVVIQGIKKAWEKTLDSVNEHTCTEFGGVVFINTREDNFGDLYQFEFREGKPTPYSESTTTVSLNFAEDVFKPDPRQGNRYAVLLFHTHPPLWAYRGKEMRQRVVGPSEHDKEEHKTIPAVVKDFAPLSGKIIDSNMPRNEYEHTAELYHYGPDRRTE